jgi:hydrogenase expression/formation protein HypC
MQITKIDGFNAHCVAKGVERDVSLFLLQDEAIKAGDYLLIHVGYAIQRISAAEALSTWELLDLMLSEDESSA